MVTQPNFISPIKSQAQFEMLTRVANDPSYAQERGITQQTAQQMLKDHTAAGAPALIPGRVSDHKDKGPSPRVKKLRPKGLFGKVGHL